MALIIVADDEVLLAEMLANFLEDAGYEVAIATHGKRALELIKERVPALLITDFMMPLMTGLELAEAIRADRKTCNLPIILVSGAQGTAARERKDLFTEVLDKPYDMNQMLDTLEKLLSGARHSQ
jgi:CheY-like chemotaxis protein